MTAEPALFRSPILGIRQWRRQFSSVRSSLKQKLRKCSHYWTQVDIPALNRSGEVLIGTKPPVDDAPHRKFAVHSHGFASSKIIQPLMRKAVSQKKYWTAMIYVERKVETTKTVCRTIRIIVGPCHNHDPSQLSLSLYGNPSMCIVTIHWKNCSQKQMAFSRWMKQKQTKNKRFRLRLLRGEKKKHKQPN